MKDLTGLRFGKLVALYPTGETRRGFKIWRCKCDCGNLTDVSVGNFFHTKSCGCLIGNSGHAVPIYKNKSERRLCYILNGMRQRCHNPNCKDYPRYGGRGIYVCDEWLNNKRSFIDWALTHGYNDDLSIDRIDNDGPYHPSNCRWVSIVRQNRNRRDNVQLNVDGSSHVLSEWNDLLGLNRGSIGWAYFNDGRDATVWRIREAGDAKFQDEMEMLQQLEF